MAMDTSLQDILREQQSLADSDPSSDPIMPALYWLWGPPRSFGFDHDLGNIAGETTMYWEGT